MKAANGQIPNKTDLCLIKDKPATTQKWCNLLGKSKDFQTLNIHSHTQLLAQCKQAFTVELSTEVRPRLTLHSNLQSANC